MIQNWKNNYSWFGNFGISSKLIQNNYETIFYLSMLVIKLIIIKIILVFIPRHIKNKLEMKINICLLFIGEITVLVPVLLISAMPVIVNHA